jgi:hypothetical protein
VLLLNGWTLHNQQLLLSNTSNKKVNCHSALAPCLADLQEAYTTILDGNERFRQHVISLCNSQFLRKLTEPNSWSGCAERRKLYSPIKSNLNSPAYSPSLYISDNKKKLPHYRRGQDLRALGG